MTIHSLILRMRSVRARAAKTLETEFKHPLLFHNEILAQHEEMLKLLEQAEYFCEGTWAEHRALLSQVKDIAELLVVRDSTGYPWRRDLIDKPAASSFFQKFLALINWLKAK